MRLSAEQDCPDDPRVALPSVIYVISNAVVGEITPAAQRGALLAIGTAIASSAGLLAPYIMGSVIESATTPLDGFNTGFFMCGVIMLVGGAIAMALVNPERGRTAVEGARRSPRRLERATMDRNGASPSSGPGGRISDEAVRGPRGYRRCANSI